MSNRTFEQTCEENLVKFLCINGWNWRNEYTELIFQKNTNCNDRCLILTLAAIQDLSFKFLQKCEKKLLSKMLFNCKRKHPNRHDVRLKTLQTKWSIVANLINVTLLNYQRKSETINSITEKIKRTRKKTRLFFPYNSRVQKQERWNFIRS